MADLRLGIALWSQASDWPGFLAAAQRAERLGYDHVWTWDHLLAIFGDPDQQIFEGYTALAAVAQATERIRLGLFVGANTFRNPALAVKCLTTIDHISAGRAVMGIGGAWFEGEHRAFGLDFGSGFGQRLDWLGEAAAATRSLLDGEEVTSPAGGRYAFDHLRVLPRPVQRHLPMMIGGSGERKTLRIVAEYADIWNISGPPHTDFDVLTDRVRRLDAECLRIGRDPVTLSRSLQQIVSYDDPASTRAIVQRAVGLGFDHIVLSLPRPYPDRAVEWLVDEIIEPVEDAAA
ncbi:MAG TPA: LLM class flavin-dependent oxidoreductase [Kribbella sp.]